MYCSAPNRSSSGHEACLLANGGDGCRENDEDEVMKKVEDSIRVSLANQAKASQVKEPATAKPTQPSAQQQKTDNLSNVVENETSSLKVDPNAKPGQPGSAEDLAAGRLAVAEVANRVIDAGHPDRVASSTLYDSEAAGLKRGDQAAVDAHNGSRTAAEAAVNGSEHYKWGHSVSNTSRQQCNNSAWKIQNKPRNSGFHALWPLH